MNFSLTAIKIWSKTKEQLIQLYWIAMDLFTVEIYRWRDRLRNFLTSLTDERKKPMTTIIQNHLIISNNSVCYLRHSDLSQVNAIHTHEHLSKFDITFSAFRAGVKNSNNFLVFASFLWKFFFYFIPEHSKRSCIA